MLQDLKTLTAGGATTVFEQRIEEAIDIGAYKTLVVQVRKPVLSGGGADVLCLQHAAVLEEAAFTDIASPVFDLHETENDVQVFQDLLRFVRWKATLSETQSAKLMVLVTARER